MTRAYKVFFCTLLLGACAVRASARLEYEHLLGGVGFFFGLNQGVECLTRIQQARLRHFIDVGFRIGI
ncbi:MAG: hypothetical protein LBK47_06645 [Prevotellaceae bacterium]|jgi:hypothetical protein|nr:hypothetical protein [Prevotellaceae bacterium]